MKFPSIELTEGPNMAASNTDTGIVELDKLIHSLEFENQQYVKMIEKENQLISSLESQIEEKVQQTLKLEQDITRFDEDTRRLHRLYTNNRDNVESLRNTINVLSDHETALSRQLEATRSKTEENRKFYMVQLANYSSIEDEYMKKYTSFPLAIELEKKKHALDTAQRQFDDIMAAKQDLEGKIALKEGELDNKIMTRIIIKIAKTQLANAQLRKDIDERLAEKAGLLEKLQEIRTTKSTGQDEQCGESHVDGGNVLSMEIDDTEQMEDSSRQVPSDEFEGFSNMSISDGQQRSSSADGQQPCPASDADELSMKDSADNHCPDEISNSMQGEQVAELNVVTTQPWSAPTHTDGGRMFTANESISREDLNTASASDQINMETIVAEQRPDNVNVTCADETLVPGSVTVAKLHFPLLSKIRPPPAIRMPVLQNLGRLPERRMAPALDTEMQKIAGDVNAEDKCKPSSSQAPQVCIPSLSRVLAPPPIHISSMQKQLKLPEQVTPPESCAEMKKVPPPSVSMLQDLRQKMSLLVPKSPLFLSTQQNQQYSLSKTLEVTEKKQVDHRPRPLQMIHTQVSQPQTVPPGSNTETLITKQGHSTPLPSNQQTPCSDGMKVTAEKQNTSLQGSAKIQASTECSVSTSIKTTDVEVPTKGCDSPPSEPVQNLFNVNIQGFNSGDPCTQSPKGKFSKCTNRRSPSSEGGHNFLLQSLFGNFEKELGEDHYESDEETAPTSIFSLFNISQSSGGGANEDSKDAGSFFTFGKFTDNTGSPSSEGPSNLLNLFTKSQTSDNSGQDFAVNIEEADKENETTFRFGVDERSDGNEGQERPLFNLF